MRYSSNRLALEDGKVQATTLRPLPDGLSHGLAGQPDGSFLWAVLGWP
jgi:hypothetical protein